MHYATVEEARKNIGNLGTQETAVTKHGKVAFYIIPPESMAKLRLLERRERLALSSQRGAEVLQGKVKGVPFDDL